MEMAVALYTDKKDKIENLSCAVNKIMLHGKYRIKLYSFMTKEAFEKSTGEGGMLFDIAVIWDEENGAELGSTFRKNNRSGVIIYLSRNRDGVWNSLKSMPLAYIVDLKDIKQFAASLLYAALWVKRGRAVFRYKTRDSIYSIPLCDIDYFESSYKVIRIHQRDSAKNIEITAKLDDIENYVPKNMFFRCHQSYFVNMKNIKLVNKASKTVTFNSGSSVFISKSRYTDFVKCFEEYE